MSAIQQTRIQRDSKVMMVRKVVAKKENVCVVFVHVFFTDYDLFSP